MTGMAFADENENLWYKNINVSVDAAGVLQGTPGLTGQLANTDGFADATLSFNLRLTAQTSKSGKAYMQFTAGQGGGIDEDIPNLSYFNFATYAPQLRLAKIWYEHTFGEKARLRGGRIDLTTDFDTNAVANDEYDQFLSAGFVNNMTMEVPDQYGTFGAMLWISPNNFFDIGVGFADAAADWDNAFDNPFSIMELDLKPKIADRQGNYRVYAWHNGKDHERLLSPEITGDANYGFGLSADQEITEDVAIFARYGHQRGSVSQAEHSWSAGVGISGRFLKREEDTLGLAFGQYVIGKDWKSLDSITGMDSGNEQRLEIYYKIKANKYFNVSPSLQWAKNPNGDKGNNSVWAFGIRTYLNLGN
jgi:carbohydrate-selective porin OprB